MGTRLEFGILGPLEVWRDGVALSIGGPRQRALLALLLCHANEIVSRDRLIDELIGDRPSEDPERLLRVQISRLRKALADGDGSRLAARRPGYMLHLEQGELDLHSFDRLVHDGREALAGQDPRRARALLHDAERLWRGHPLADLDGESFARVEAQRLSELRLLALEDRVEAELALGEHVTLCGELPALIDEHPLRERLRFQLMLALYRSGQQSEALALYRETHRLLRDELGLTPSRRLRDLERAILTQAESLGPEAEVPIANLVRGPDICPFKGLDFFDLSDADDFFGRERIAAELVARAVDHGLVGIVGASGSGKSSLLRAGVLAALRTGALPGSGRWRQVLIRPGEHPGAQLRDALGGEPLASAVAGLSPGTRLVLAVDQLEELFTVCERAHERVAFLEQLWEAALDDRRRVLVLVALRGDFYAHAACHPGFAELLSSNHLLLPAMDRDEIAAAIVRPAARLGLEVEPPLVEALVADAAAQSGGLPLLSAMLVELWDARETRTLSYRHYRASGGIQAAVARLAEAAFEALDDRQRAVARGVLLRLAVERDGALVRRRAPLHEVDRLDGHAVLATLVAARLLTVGEDKVELSHEALLREWPRYRGWLEADRAGRRLHAHLAAAAADWDGRERDPSELYRGARLAAALEWSAHNGELLNAIEHTFLERSRGHSEREQRRQRRQNQRLRALLLAVGALLVVAVAAAALARSGQDSARAQARAALARQLGDEAVSEPRLDLAMLMARAAVSLDRSTQTETTLLATVLRYPAVIGTIVLPQGTSARLAFAPDGRTLALGDALGDLRFLDARTHSLVAPTVGQALADQAPAYSNDGTLIAYRSSVCRCGFIIVRNTRTEQIVSNLAVPLSIPVQVQEISGQSIIIAPDDRTVYYAYWTPGSTRAYIEHWALPSGRDLGTVAIGSGPLLAIRAIDGGARLAVLRPGGVSAYDAHTLRLAYVAHLVAPVPAGSLGALGPEARIATIATPTGAVSLIDTATGRRRELARRAGGPVAAILPTRDGRSVVTVTRTGSVTVREIGSGLPAPTLVGPSTEVQSAALSPDGRTLYTSSASGVLLEWDLAGDRRFARRIRLPHAPSCCRDLAPPAPAFALSPDATRFAARIASTTVGVFSTGGQRELASFTVARSAGTITALAWSPRDDEIAVAGRSGFVELWSAGGPPRLLHHLIGLVSLFGQPEVVQALAFSPDGALLAAGDADRTGPVNFGPTTNDAAGLTVWRTATGARVAAPTWLNANFEPTAAPAGDIVLAFSGDGRHLAMSQFDGSIAILDPETGAIEQALDNAGGSTALAFAPDGTLAAGTPAGTMERFDIATGGQLGPPLTVSGGAVAGLAFARAGALFATSGAGDGAVKLWFAAGSGQSAQRLSTDPGSTAALAFAPDGRSLVAVDDRTGAFTWPTSLPAWERWACAVAGRDLTRQEWSGLVGGAAYAATCA